MKVAILHIEDHQKFSTFSSINIDVSAAVRYTGRMRRLDNIDLRLLRVFVALAEAGSFSGAQMALNLSQSTLSTHIAALERSLGAPLCLRGRGGFRLTPFGTATLAATRQLFSDIESFQDRVGQSGDRLIGRLSVGIVDSVISSPALSLQGPIRRTIEAAPEIFIDLRLGTPLELEQWVAEGKRDVVIGPFARHGPGVVYVALHREAQGLYCGRLHDLFAVEKPEVAAIEASLFSVRGYRQLEDLYRVNHPRARATVIHMEAQAMLILSGQYIGFLPCDMAQDYVARGQMRELKPRTYRFFSQHYAAYRRVDQEQPLIKLFLGALRRQAAFRIVDDVA
jgi:DNA-binding transcriptional LysR family regulator